MTTHLTPGPLVAVLLTWIFTLTGCQIMAFEADTNSLGPAAGSVFSIASQRRFWPSFQSAPTLTWDVVKGPPSGVEVGADGTVTMSAADEIIVRSRQTVGANFSLEFTVPDDFGKTQHLPYLGLDSYPIASRSTTLWGINSIGNAVRVDGQTASYTVAQGDQIVMEGREGVVRYYKRHAGTLVLLYVSALPPIGPGDSYPITIIKPIGGTIGNRWVLKSPKLTGALN